MTTAEEFTFKVEGFHLYGDAACFRCKTQLVPTEVATHYNRMWIDVPTQEEADRLESLLQELGFAYSVWHHEANPRVHRFMLGGCDEHLLSLHGIRDIAKANGDKINREILERYRKP